MIETGITYALLAACFGGAYMFSIKQYLTDIQPTVIAVVTSLVSVGVYVPYVAWTTAGSRSELVPDLDPTGLVIVAVTVFCGASGFLLFLTAIDTGDVSYVAPLSKIVPAFVLPIEIIALQVFLTPQQAFGVGVVTVGVYFANYQGGSLVEPVFRLASNRAAQVALGSAAAYGLFDVLQRFVLQELGMHPFLWVLITRLGIAALLIPIAFRVVSIPRIRSQWRGFAIVGALNACLAHFAILSFSLLPASIASPIVNSQSVVAVLLGGALLREMSFRYRILGAVFTIAGIVFIVSG